MEFNGTEIWDKFNEILGEERKLFFVNAAHTTLDLEACWEK